MTAEIIQFPGNFRKSPQAEMAERLSERMGCEVAYEALEGPTLDRRIDDFIAKYPKTIAYLGGMDRPEDRPKASSLFEPIIEMPADCPS